MNVAFLNENTLGHTSYLPRFVAEFGGRPELGVVPHLMDALPFPPHLDRWGNTSIRGLRRYGLDFQTTRWRMAGSRHLREQLDLLRGAQRIEAVVVNTQSMGLALADLDPSIPVLVALDATFTQLARSSWFAPNRLARWFQPLTLSVLLRRERKLYRRASRLLPWSEPVADSLVRDYRVDSSRITVLPPSMKPPPRRLAPRENGRAQVLFVGGDFIRKGGPLLRECHRRYLADRCDLQVVTQSELQSEPGMNVLRGLTAGDPRWRRSWESAAAFVFPSRLETFGIVLLEALAFEVPVVSSRAGAAESLLGAGDYGTLLTDLTPETLRDAIRSILDQPTAAAERARRGREHFEREYDLGANTVRLAGMIHQALGR